MAGLNSAVTFDDSASVTLSGETDDGRFVCTLIEQLIAFKGPSALCPPRDGMKLNPVGVSERDVVRSRLEARNILEWRTL